MPARLLAGGERPLNGPRGGILAASENISHALQHTFATRVLYTERNHTERVLSADKGGWERYTHEFSFRLFHCLDHIVYNV